MAIPSKKMRVSDAVLYELLQGNEYIDISESEYNSDSEINMKILSFGQSVSCDEEGNLIDNSSM
jgi:hypothetical protein